MASWPTCAWLPGTVGDPGSCLKPHAQPRDPLKCRRALAVDSSSPGPPAVAPSSLPTFGLLGSRPPPVAAHASGHRVAICSGHSQTSCLARGRPPSFPPPSPATSFPSGFGDWWPESSGWPHGRVLYHQRSHGQLGLWCPGPVEATPHPRCWPRHSLTHSPRKPPHSEGPHPGIQQRPGADPTQIFPWALN